MREQNEQHWYDCAWMGTIANANTNINQICRIANNMCLSTSSLLQQWLQWQDYNTTNSRANIDSTLMSFKDRWYWTGCAILVWLCMNANIRMFIYNNPPKHKCHHTVDPLMRPFLRQWQERSNRRDIHTQINGPKRL